MELSIIVPLYNEEESIRPLYESIKQAIDPMNVEYELIFVDDGSRDSTFDVASELAHRDQRLTVIKFRRNFGQTPAMAAGIDFARGSVLITIDGDLQNDPADIPTFVQEIKEGFDLVAGWRYKRQDRLISRKIPSKIANWMIGKVTGVPIKDNGCSLKAYRAETIKKIPLYAEMHRFIPAVASLTGARIKEIKVRHHARRYGVSKYGLSRIYKVLVDLLTIKTIVSFASRPLLWFAILATPFGVLGATALSISLYRTFSDFEAASVPVAGVGVLFEALACFLLLVGIIGELIYKTGQVDLAGLCLVTAAVVRREGGAKQENGAQGLAAEEQCPR
jgi:glycosyltransferase involved in cell wall biosynthesis